MAAAVVLCTSCGTRLARDNGGTVCSPCRRTYIESSAKQGALAARDTARITEEFTAHGLYGVADYLQCTPEEALDVVLNSQLVPFVPPRRRLLLRRLVGLGDCSHIAAGQALEISRWTVATYRRQLGIARTDPSPTSAS